MKVNHETGWIESLSNAELQRLSEAFNSVADLRAEPDRNINAWLGQIINSRRLMTELRAKHGYDEWGSPVKVSTAALSRLTKE